MKSRYGLGTSAPPTELHGRRQGPHGGRAGEGGDVVSYPCVRIGVRVGVSGRDPTDRNCLPVCRIQDDENLRAVTCGVSEYEFGVG